ncbi:aromatic acid exporter family protein [Cytobacillus firmus]|uniref:aromatic acid exporter family protein n=1 Tax=Bacillaceae TaxID=186817 RepID=UPI0013CF9D28|nr:MULTISPECIES: aromatic acid exporter family protein [Bacillaceae]MCC3647760.1 aromatic acid exporter family protein [Cytobacillus oceanisediminis]USK37840.1 aromatic acid exporter family protein [Cytobacillus firmus]
MKYRIGYRTIKTAVGTSISIMIAQMLQLDNFVSAGILTILCIKVTKKKSLRASWDRFFACLLAMAFSSLFFEGIAYHPLVIGLLLLFFIPAAVMAKASDGIVTSSVIILHIYSAGEVSKDLLLNELGIIIVGIGVALIANLYMPSLESKLKEYRLEIEENFKVIFDEIVRYLRTHESSWDGREITETMEMIDEAKALAFRDVENHFRRDESLYYHYFKMREKQFEIIERVLPSVTSIALPVEQGEMIADFIEELSEHIHPGNTALLFLEKLYRMKVSFENMELPKTREEFEARAALLHFVKEMEQYLIIKSSFKGLKDKEMNQSGTGEAN